LNSKLGEMLHQERGLERAPLFLHFESSEMEALVPKLEDYESNGGLRMDARRSLQLAMMVEERAAGFFREYADKFLETQGKELLIRYAEAGMSHRGLMEKRLEEMLATT
jgi:hypothetical protein